MNKIYKVIWNHALNCFTVVSETAKSKGKTKSQRSASGVVSSGVWQLNGLTRAMLLMGGLVASNIALASSDVIGTDNQVSGIDPSKVQIVGDRNNLTLVVPLPNTQDLLRDIQISGNDNAILSSLNGVNLVGNENVIGQNGFPYPQGNDLNSNIRVFGDGNWLNNYFENVMVAGNKNDLKNTFDVNVVGSKNKVSTTKDSSIIGNENTITKNLLKGVSAYERGGSVIGNKNTVELENANVLGSKNTVTLTLPDGFSKGNGATYRSGGAVIGDGNQVNTQLLNVDSNVVSANTANNVLGDRNTISGTSNYLVGSANKLGTKLASKVSENHINLTSYNDAAEVDLPDVSFRNSVDENTVIGSGNLVLNDYNEVFGSRNTIATPRSNYGGNNTVVGGDNAVYSSNSILLGASNEAGKKEGNISGAEGSVLLGIGNKLWGKSNNVLGKAQRVLGDDNIAIGSENGIGKNYSGMSYPNLPADIKPKESIVIGKKITTIANNAVVIGDHIESQYDNNVILGSFSEDAKAKPVTATDGVVFSGGNPVGVVSVGAKDKERQIVNVAAGRISAESTDAVNGSQIFALASYLEQALEGGGSGGNSQYIGINGEGWESNQNGQGAMGVRSIAIGTGAEATGYQASSIGQSNTASGTNAYVYGGYNNVGAHDSTVLGTNNTTGQNVEVLGRFSEITPVGMGRQVVNNNILGNENKTDGSNIIVIGNNNSSGNSEPPMVGRMVAAAIGDAIDEEIHGEEFPEPLPTPIMSNDYNTIIGDDNNAIGSLNRVMGWQNNLFATRTVVEGDNNIIGAINPTINDFPVDKIKVNGDDNVVYAVNAMISGDDNRVLNSEEYLQSLITDDPEQNIGDIMALGNRNIIRNSDETVVVGHENSLVGDGLYVMGSRNQQATRTQNPNVISPVPDSSLSSNSNIIGSDNVLSNLLLTSVLGANNKVDAQNTAVVGNSNTGNLVNRTVILGNQNHQATNSYLTASVGDGNMSNGGQLGIVGYSNTVGFDNTMDFKVADLTGLNVDAYGNPIEGGFDAYGNPIDLENPLFPNPKELPSMDVYKTFVMGNDNTVFSDQSVVLGSENTVREKDGSTASTSNVVIGGENNLKGDTNVVIGQNSEVYGDQLIAVGTGNVIAGKNSGAFGDPNEVTGTGSYAFGNDNTITADNTFVLGNNVNTSQANSVILGNNSTDSAAVAVAGANIRGTNYAFAGSAPAGVMSVGSVGSERQVQNVAAGQLSATSTDAVNGSQLFATNQAIEELLLNGGSQSGGVNYYGVNDGGVRKNNYQGEGAVANDTIAIGMNASATKNNSVVIGNDALLNSENSVALGQRIDVGNPATTSRPHSNVVAVGTDISAASNTKSIGTNILNYGESSVAIGSDILTKGNSNLVIGNSLSTNVNSEGTRQIFTKKGVLIGNDSEISQVSEIALPNGEGQVVTSAAPAPVAVGNNNNANSSVIFGSNNTGKLATIMGVGNKATSGGVAVGMNNEVSYSTETALGVNNKTSGYDSTAIGANNTNTGNLSVLLGSSLKNTNDRNVIIGSNSILTPYFNGDFNQNSILIGSNTNVSGRDSNVIGVNNTVTGASNSDPVRTGNNVLAFNATVTGADNSVIGSNTTVQGNKNRVNASDISVTGDENIITGSTITTGNGSKNIATGSDLQLNGNNNISMGVANRANGSSNLIMGESNYGNGSNGILLGDNHSVYGSNIVAIGANINARKDFYNDPKVNVAMGSNVESTDTLLTVGNGTEARKATIAIGDNSVAGRNSILLGSNSVATNQNSVVVGNNNQIGERDNIIPSSKSNGVAIGNNNQTFSQDSLLLGTNNTVTADNGVAISNFANVAGLNSIAIGQNANSGQGAVVTKIDDSSEVITFTSENFGFANNAIALGNSSNALSDNGIAIGNQAKSGMQVRAIFTESGDVVTIGGNSNAIALGNQANAMRSDSVAVGGNSVSDKEAVAVGSNVTAGNNSIAIGRNTSAGKISTINPVQTGNLEVREIYSEQNPNEDAQQAILNEIANKKFTYNSVTNTLVDTVTNKQYTPDEGYIDYQAEDGTIYEVVVGSDLNGRTYLLDSNGNPLPLIAIDESQSQKQSIAIGDSTTVNGNQSIAIGTGNVVNGDHSGAFGDPNTVTGTGSYAFGNDNTITADNTFVVGNNVNTTQSNSVILGNNSADSAAVAVAGANIRGTDYAFAGAAPAGVVSVGSAGGERQVQNVAAGQLSATSTDAVNGSQLFATNQAIENLIATGAEPLAVKYDSTAKDKVTLAGTEGTTLTNVKAGAIATDSTDAVNGSQLSATNTTINNVNTTLTNRLKYFGTKSTDSSGNPLPDLANVNGEGATGDYAVAIGAGAKATGYGAVALGSQATRTVTNPDGTTSQETDAAPTAEGINSFATGLKTLAKGQYSTAMGGYTTASGDYSTAMGGSTTASGNYSTVMGYTTDASGDYSTAMGGSTSASGDYSTAMGGSTGASGDYSTAMGYTTNASGDYSTAMGEATTASGDHSTAMGKATTASGWISTAMGEATTASGDHSTAMGKATGASGDYSTATGGYTKALGNYSTAMGEFTTASGQTSTAMGYNTNASGDYSTAMGYITNASGQNSTAMGEYTNASGQNSTAMGANTKASGNYSTVMGLQSQAIGDYSTAMGLQSQAIGDNSLATNRAVARAQNSIAMGKGAITGSSDNSTERAIAIGENSQALADNTIAIGTGNVVSGAKSGAFGDPNTVSGTGSYAFGNDNTIAQNNTFVLGNNVNTTQGSSVVLGNDSTDSAAVAVAGANIRGTDYTFAGTSPTGVVSVGSVGGERQIQNVAAGQLTATSTDAVNGSQLFATNQALESLIATGADPLAVKYDSDAKDKVTLAGTTGTGTTITNLKAGEINSTSTDAVNGSQVSTIAQNSRDVMGGNAVTNVDGTMTVSNIGGTGEDTIDGAVGVAYNTAKKAKSTVSQGDNIVVTSSLNADGSTDYKVATASDVDFNSVTAQKSTVGTVAIDSAVADANGNTLINGVGAGAIASGSTQAINGDQIFNLAKASSNNFGGGSVVNADGTISAPTYTVNNDNFNNVGDAISALDASRVHFFGVNSTSTYDSNYNGEGAIGNNAIAIGVSASSQGDKSIAMGDNAFTRENSSVAIGADSVDKLADATSSTTYYIGANNKELVIGGYAGNNPLAVVSVGNDGIQGEVPELTRQIAHVAAGKVTADSTDAINGSQLYATTQSLANMIEGISNIDPLAVHYDSVTKDKVTLAGTTGTTITNLKAGEINSTSTDAVNGSQVSTIAQNSRDVMGGNAVTNVDGTMTVSNIGGTGEDTIDGAVGVAYNTAKKAKSTVSQGDNIVVTSSLNADGSTDYNVATADDLNANSITTNKSSTGTVAIDSSITDAKGKTVINGVGDGEVKLGSNQAINGDQLYRASKSTADSLGGDSSVNADGSINQPTYSVQSNNYNNVGDAISALDTADKLNVKYDSVTKDKVTLAGTTGTTITNLKAGEINSTSTDAVNGSQVSTIAQNSRDVMGGNAVTNVDGTMTVSNIGGTGEDTIDGAVGVAYNTAKKAKSTVSQGDNIVVTSSLNADGSTDYNVATASDVDFNSVMAKNVKMGNTIVINTIKVDQKGNSVISGVGAGTIAKGSTEAINGDQLYNATTSVSSSLGGGSVLNNDGSISNPAYNISGTTYNNVGDALTALDNKVVNGSDPLAVKYDSLNKDTVTFAGESGTKLTNVKDGEISATSSDAITGKQLNQANQDTANYLGGGSSIGVDGRVTAPTYTVDNSKYNNVGDAITALDGKNQKQDQAIAENTVAINQTNNRITNEVSRIDQVNNRQDQTLEVHSQDIDYLKNADKYNVKYNKDFSKVSLAGADGTTITNLKAGEINSTSTDAINGSQINKITQNSKDVMGGNAVTNVDGTMTVSNIGGTGENTIDGAIGVAYNAAKKAKTTVSAGKNIVVTPTVNADGSSNYQVETADDLNANSITTNKSSTGTVAIDSSITDAKGKTVINGVGDGEVKLGSNQAINGDQLYRASKSTADNLGGGSSVNADGSISKPTYTVSQANYNNVGDAVTALDNANKNSVKYDSDAKDKVTLAGTTGTTISNVKAGDVSKTSTQAINGSQLYNSNQTIANTFGGGASIDNKGITAPTYTIASQEYHDVGSAFNAIDQRADQIEQNAYAYTNQKVSDLDDKLSAGIASTAALEQAPYVAGKWTYAAGAAYYNGQGAAGATIRRTADSGRWSFSSGVASGTSNGAKPLMRIAVSGVFN